MSGFSHYNFRTQLLGRATVRLALIVVLTAAGCTSKPGSDRQGPTLQSNVIDQGEVIQRITAPGLIVAKRSSFVSTPYAGYVRRIFVQVGEQVKSGMPVISVAQSASTPDTEIFPLRAPFPGTVVQVLKSEGEFVEAGGKTSALVRIDDLSQLQIEAAINELDYPKLKSNQKVRIRISALPGQIYNGVIRRISLAAREKTDFFRGAVEFPVRIEILDADGKIKPGMSATLDVIADLRQSVVRVANVFLKREGEKYSVTLKSGETRFLQLGLQSDEYSEVLSGLKVGDELQSSRASFTSKRAP